MISTDEAITTLQRMLDDTDGEQFSRELLLNWMQDGYDRIAREGECLFDMQMYESRPRTANYTRDFERPFIDSQVMEKFTCTRESDGEFMDGEALVSNHTRPSDSVYMTESGHTATKTGLRKLPEGWVSVDRVTHHWLRLSPQHDRYNRLTRVAYQTLEGGVFQYQMDQDGWQYIRLVNVPAFMNESETITGKYGPIRQVTSYEMDQESVIGSYGIIRSVPRHFVCGTGYGATRKFVEDLNNTRVEMYRLGAPLHEGVFELPDRFVKYVQWWALYRAYSTPGECESPKLAEHYKMRFEAAVERVKNRVNSVNRDRALIMGQHRTYIKDNYLEHFPADYGYARPFRR